jgi:hypothetical protein
MKSFTANSEAAMKSFTSADEKVQQSGEKLPNEERPARHQD